MAKKDWHTRLTSHGTVHMVKEQDQPQSCAIACTLMVNFKIRKGALLLGAAAAAAGIAIIPVFGGLIGPQLMQTAVDYAVKTEPEVYAAYGAIRGSAYDGTETILVAELPRILRHLGLGEWEVAVVPPIASGRLVADSLRQGDPVFVGISWSNGTHHLVVADTVDGRGDLAQIFLCDPGDGQVHVVNPQPMGGVRYRVEGYFNGHVCRRKAAAVPPPVPYNPATG